MVKIYVADDEKNIRELLVTVLTGAGYEVTGFETGDQLLLAFLDQEADLVVLDVMMPGSSGFDIAQKIRSRSEVPLILLTARDSDRDFMAGFASGVDDYFTKPFSPLKLSLRIQAMLKRLKQPDGSSPTHLTFSGLSLSPTSRSAHYDGLALKLTNTEFEVLKLLLEHAGEAVSRDSLLEQVWGYESEVETRVTDDTIKRLRKKLRAQAPAVAIETVWGYGFKLVEVPHV